jgi:GTP-binding protein
LIDAPRAATGRLRGEKAPGLYNNGQPAATAAPANLVPTPFAGHTALETMNKVYRNARFLTSARRRAEFPPDRGREVAFAGRSNAGKSSAINLITGRRNLARTSKTPGRTQLINFFDLGEERRLVDLPGYGYAKVPEVQRRQWGQMIEAYLGSRRSLRGVIVVMDLRRGLTDYDRQMLGWCQAQGLAVHLLLTKADKLSRGAGAQTARAVAGEAARAGLKATWQLFSATRGLGVDEAHARLDAWLELARVSHQAAPKDTKRNA